MTVRYLEKFLKVKRNTTDIRICDIDHKFIIDFETYLRRCDLSLSRDKDGVKKLAEEGQILEHSTDILKSPVIPEFLKLKEDHRYSENDLETAIINKLEHFMLEIGKGFLFEGRQRRISLDGDHYWVDLAFYNAYSNALS